MYLAGFALTLGFVIARLVELMQQVTDHEEEKDKIAKRVVVLEEESKLQKSTSTSVAGGDAGADNATGLDEPSDPNDILMTDISSKPDAATTLRKRPNAAGAASAAAQPANAKSD